MRCKECHSLIEDGYAINQYIICSSCYSLLTLEQQQNYTRWLRWKVNLSVFWKLLI